MDSGGVLQIVFPTTPGYAICTISITMFPKKKKSPENQRVFVAGAGEISNLDLIEDII